MLTDTTPTSAPQFKDKNLVVEPVKTDIKTTQGDVYYERILKENITVQYPYTKEEYEAGTILNLFKDSRGFYMVDGYGCHTIDGYTRNGKKEKTNYLPLELFETKQYAIVREYKTTTWEIN